MKIKLRILVIMCVNLAVSQIVKADSTDDYVQKYYFAFDTDGTGMVMTESTFEAEVPISEQGAVLSKILDRATQSNPPNYHLTAIILGLLGNLSPNVVWSEHLEHLIYDQAKSPDKDVRSCVSILLAAKERDKARDLILSFKNDPDDEVRADFLGSIDKWPDAEQIYLKYISTHESDSNYKHSVEVARDCLRINRQTLNK